MTGKVQENGGQGKKKATPYKTYRYSHGNFWKPGDLLTERDLKMLHPVKEYYRRRGYPPARGDMANAGALKNRFRIWKDVLLAAEVPSMNDPECQVRKQKAREWEKQVRAER